MQCKDISDSEFLRAVRVATTLRRSHWEAAEFDDIWAVLSGFPEHVKIGQSLPDFWKEYYLPYRLVKAKARILFRKGKLSGGWGEPYPTFYVITEEMREQRKINHEKFVEEQKLYKLEYYARLSNLAIEIVYRGGSGRPNTSGPVYPLPVE
jgi:hypothetical protein